MEDTSPREKILDNVEQSSKSTTLLICLLMTLTLLGYRRLPKPVYHLPNLKKEQDGLKNDKSAIMQQKVHLLILKHIKLEDIDMWFRTFILHFLICFQCILFIYMFEI